MGSQVFLTKMCLQVVVHFFCMNDMKLNFLFQAYFVVKGGNRIGQSICSALRRSFIGRFAFAIFKYKLSFGALT